MVIRVFQGKNPHFKKQAAPQADKAQPKQGADSTLFPMEVTCRHPSLGRTRIINGAQADSTAASLDRATGLRRQRIDYIQAGAEDDERYVNTAQEVAAEIEEENGFNYKSDSAYLFWEWSLLPFIRRTLAGVDMTFLVDTDAS